MFAFVEQAVEKGELTSKNGTFATLKDFSYEWAQMNYYNFFDTGASVQDFALRAHFKWSSGIANPEPSGCGFAYRIGDKSAHYLVYLDRGAVNMGVYVPRIDRRGSYRIGVSKGSGRMSIDFGEPAEADFAIIVSGGNAYVYIDGKETSSYLLYSDFYKYEEGALAYTIVSGTNKDYGTRCEITNAELWKVTLKAFF
jgi:hypothetical protein